MKPIISKSTEPLRKFGDGAFLKILFDSENGAKNFAMGTVIINPKERTAEHVRDVEEIIFAHRGTTWVITDTEEYKLDEGDCILIPAGVTHYHANKGDKAIEQIWIFAPQGPEKANRKLEFVNKA